MSRQLPVIQELYDGDLALKHNQNEFNILVNQPPNPKWVKDHPYAKGVKYIPIERIEYLLTRLFLRWRVEIKDSKIVGNSMCVTVRLHYQNIEDDQWSFQDGIGASPLQTDKGTGAIEFSNLKSNAVMLAAPAAETYAIKDAAEKIGKLFGKDINRKDEIGYDTLMGAIPEEGPSINQLGYAEELVRKSNLDDDQKEAAYAELANPELTIADYTAIRNKLIDAQPKTY
jgi:hypothetical protein